MGFSSTRWGSLKEEDSTLLTKGHRKCMHETPSHSRSAGRIQAPPLEFLPCLFHLTSLLQPTLCLTSRMPTLDTQHWFGSGMDHSENPSQQLSLPYLTSSIYLEVCSMNNLLVYAIGICVYNNCSVNYSYCWDL